MKYLYVLVNSTTGFYTEQTYVSMLSLRHVTPDAFISLLVDDNTANIQNNKFLDSIKSLVNEYKIISLPSDMPAIAKSRFIKTSMREYISDDFLFVDSDTIWANPVNEDDFTFDIMGVLDQHVLFSQKKHKDSFTKVFKETNCYSKTEFYINSGVLYSRDSEFSRSFFKQWHDKWKESSLSGIFIDQPSLNCIVSEHIDTEKIILSGEYNCQIVNTWNFFFKAKIIHYFSSCSTENVPFHSPYLPQQLHFWKQLQQGKNELTLDEITHFPLDLFEKNISIANSEQKKFESTLSYSVLKDMYTRKILGKKSKFDFFEKILPLFIRKNN